MMAQQSILSVISLILLINHRYLIQVPRVYNVWRKLGFVKSFSEQMENVFKPLFEATLDPQGHPELTEFLTQVTGFDSVDDESKPDDPLAPDARDWTAEHNPPYAYWMFFMFANITSLNHLRKSRGMSEFTLRPHCGEAGPVNHLADCFLVASGINHGVQLQKSMPLQYLYYLAQVGMAVSPLSNAALFLDYDKNPFSLFFKRGLFVSLSTDDPLQVRQMFLVFFL